jgi:hypothetical protein
MKAFNIKIRENNRELARRCLRLKTRLAQSRWFDMSVGFCGRLETSVLDALFCAP